MAAAEQAIGIIEQTIFLCGMTADRSPSPVGTEEKVCSKRNYLKNLSLPIRKFGREALD